MADIDLTDTEFASIPIFNGIFNGKGHTIKGLIISYDVSNLGLFRYLTQTVVVWICKLTVTIATISIRQVTCYWYAAGGFALFLLIVCILIVNRRKKK